ncbi:MAG TPA: hypothetical protein VFE07_13550 [Marmoricola sp.]|nr:hypothetical protein [Marmoricola sp.]
MDGTKRALSRRLFDLVMFGVCCLLIVVMIARAFDADAVWAKSFSLLVAVGLMIVLVPIGRLMWRDWTNS